MSRHITCESDELLPLLSLGLSGPGGLRHSINRLKWKIRRWLSYLQWHPSCSRPPSLHNKWSASHIRQDRTNFETCFLRDLQIQGRPSQEVQICLLNDMNQLPEKLFHRDVKRGAVKVHEWLFGWSRHSSCDDDKSCRKTKQLRGLH